MGPSLISFRLVVNSYEHLQHLCPIFSLGFFSRHRLLCNIASSPSVTIISKLRSINIYSTNKNVFHRCFPFYCWPWWKVNMTALYSVCCFFLPGNHHVVVQYCPSEVNLLVAVLQGSIRLQSACSNSMCIKKKLAEDRILPASLMLWPLDFLIDVSWTLKMQDQIFIPSLDKLRSALAGHCSLLGVGREQCDLNQKALTF